MSDTDASGFYKKVGDVFKKAGDTELFRKAVKFRPAIIRGILGVGIAGLNDFRHSMGIMSQLKTVRSFDWSDAIVGAVLASLIAWRLFLDDSVGRAKRDEG